MQNRAKLIKAITILKGSIVIIIPVPVSILLEPRISKSERSRRLANLMKAILVVVRYMVVKFIIFVYLGIIIVGRHMKRFGVIIRIVIIE